jgi:hypothetical protein
MKRKMVQLVRLSQVTMIHAQVGETVRILWTLRDGSCAHSPASDVDSGDVASEGLRYPRDMRDIDSRRDGLRIVK